MVAVAGALADATAAAHPSTPRTAPFAAAPRPCRSASLPRRRRRPASEIVGAAAGGAWGAPAGAWSDVTPLEPLGAGRAAAPPPPPGGDGAWQRLPGGVALRTVAGCAVLHPVDPAATAGGPIKGVVRLVGGAFLGAAPALAYPLLARLVAAGGYTVVCVPYDLTFRHWRSAADVQAAFRRAADALRAESGGADAGGGPGGPPPFPALAAAGGAFPRGAPTFGLGHSNGALLTLLIGSLSLNEGGEEGVASAGPGAGDPAAAAARAPPAPVSPHLADVVVSFNNRPLSGAVPVPEALSALGDAAVAAAEAGWGVPPPDGLAGLARAAADALRAPAPAGAPPPPFGGAPFGGATDATRAWADLQDAADEAAERARTSRGVGDLSRALAQARGDGGRVPRPVPLSLSLSLFSLFLSFFLPLSVPLSCSLSFSLSLSLSLSLFLFPSPLSVSSLRRSLSPSLSLSLSLSLPRSPRSRSPRPSPSWRAPRD